MGNAAFRRLVRPVRQVVADQRLEWGLPELSSPAADSPLAQLCQIPRAFDYPRRELPKQMHYVGPLHDLTSRPKVPFDFSRLDGRPLIYASMGSVQNRLPHVFNIIAQARAKKALVVFNKIDLPCGIDLEPGHHPFRDFPSVRISALTGEGLDELREAIMTCLLDVDM